jgi:hypothetical protein
MKKSILVSLALGIGLSLFTTKYVFGNNSQNSSKIHYGANAEYMREFNDISTLVQSADTIIKAKLISKTPESEDGLFAYNFTIEKLIYGNVDNYNIKVYERIFQQDENHLKGQVSLFEEGKDYYLLLESWEDEYYDSTIYTTVHTDAIVKVTNSGELLLNKEIFSGVKNERELVRKIEDTLKVSNKKISNENKRKIKTKIKDINELILLSDSIVVIKPLEVINENKNVKLVRASVSEKIKGELQNQVTALLPPNAKIGEEYLLFGNQIEGTLRISTRNNSFFTKDTEEFNEIYNKIKK